MAKPATRQQLIDYCFRKLGAPVLEINVDDDQVDIEVTVEEKSSGQANINMGFRI